MSQQKSKGIAAAAAIGAVIGVVAGVLFAPKSGKETRQDIKDTADKVAARLQEQAKKLQSELSVLVEKAETQFKEKKITTTARAKELVEKAKHERELLAVLAKSVKEGKADDKDLDEAINKASEAKEALAKYLKK